MKRVIVLLAAFVLVLAAGPLFARGGEEKGNTPGVTDTEITVGFSMVMSGPLGFLGSSAAKDTQACFNKYNEAGGIYGRKLKLITYDSTLEVAQDLANYRKLFFEDKVFCCIWGMWGSVSAAYPLFEQNQVPWLFTMGPPSNTIFPPRKYLFNLFPTIDTQVATWIQWLPSQKWKRIGIIYSDNENGEDALRVFAEKTKGTGIEIVATEALKDDASVSAAVQVAKLRAAKPDAVFLTEMTMEPAAIAVKEIKKIGWDVQIMMNMPLSNYFTLSLLTPKEADGMLGGFWGKNYNPVMDDPDTYTPRMIEAKNTILKYFPEEAGNMDGAIEQYMNVEVFIEALKRAGKNLTREGLIKALESMKNWDSGKGSFVTFSPTRREGLSGGVIMKAQGNKAWKPITDWIEVPLK